MIEMSRAPEIIIRGGLAEDCKVLVRIDGKEYPLPTISCTVIMEKGKVTHAKIEMWIWEIMAEGAVVVCDENGVPQSEIINIAFIDRCRKTEGE